VLLSVALESESSTSTRVCTSKHPLRRLCRSQSFTLLLALLPHPLLLLHRLLHLQLVS
jgi:hypothetical protein